MSQRIEVPVVTVLVRYCEIGLKSAPVRKRFEARLKENVLTMLAYDRVEVLVSQAGARMYLETEDPEGAVRAVTRVFGIASVSVAEHSSSAMEDICATAEIYSRGRLPDGSSFAVRARREGSHPYTSTDVGREAGSAIYEANKNRGIKVDLTRPEKEFYVEVRDSGAFIFDTYINGPGGLPLGTQGKVVADTRDDRGLLSAWLMMKRGCKALVTEDSDLLRNYDPGLRIADMSEAEKRDDVMGIVLGSSVADDISFSAECRIPVYFPTIGMDDTEVSARMVSVAEGKF